jgi:ammonia channel protein AmtB
VGPRTSQRKRVDQFPPTQCQWFTWLLSDARDFYHSCIVQVSLVALGTFILWFGWLGFNGGSAYGANLRAVVSIWNSMIAAAFGGMTWGLLDYRVGHKFSTVALCSGTIAGLVAATGSCGYIPPWSALIMGVVAGLVCNVGTKRELFRSTACNAMHLTREILFSQVLP